MTTKSKKNGPGKSHRTGISLIQLFDMFPDESAARGWLENIRWPDGKRECPRCFSERTRPVKSEKPMPYWCSACRKYFSVKVGTVMESSKIPLRKWVITMYLMTTNLKGVSSMKLHRDLGITQTSAWFMEQRIREGWVGGIETFQGPVEVDETYIGGKVGNMSNAKRRQLKEQGIGRGPSGKTAVVGMKDRNTNRVEAEVVETTDRNTLQGFVAVNTEVDAVVYTDEHGSYRGLPRPHQSIKHSAKEYVDGQAHTNGIESFWAMFKRSITGTYHHLSVKHLHRYVHEFAGRHNVRDLDTLAQMTLLAYGMVGKRLKYRDLIGPPQL